MAYIEPIRELDEAPLVKPGSKLREITDDIAGVTETPAPLGWWICFLIASSLAGVFGRLRRATSSGAASALWGNTSPVYWAWDITNFVWWVGIGHAGTLISAILFLFRQKWRTAINRFAGGDDHLRGHLRAHLPGHPRRPAVAVCFTSSRSPNQMNLWPNFKSPLLWDVFAVGTYSRRSRSSSGTRASFRTSRPSATGRSTPGGSASPGFFALGWRGSNRHWQNYERAYLILAAISTPLVLSVHSVVSMDFATSVIPGWHTTIFPPYFVAGAIFSGFAMVETVLLIARTFFKLERVVLMRHLELMNKFLLLTSLLVGYAYSMEFFVAWYSGNQYEMAHFLKNRPTGPYWWAWAWMMIPNMIVPQIYWFKRARTSIPIMFVVSIIINIGMWFERFVIIVSSLNRDFLPSAWGLFRPTIIDVGTFVGTIGVFFFLFLLFMRWLPMVSMTEVKGTMPQADPHRHAEDEGEHAPKHAIERATAAEAGGNGLVPEGAE